MPGGGAGDLDLELLYLLLFPPVGSGLSDLDRDLLFPPLPTGDGRGLRLRLLLLLTDLSLLLGGETDRSTALPFPFPTGDRLGLYPPYRAAPPPRAGGGLAEYEPPLRGPASLTEELFLRLLRTGAGDGLAE